MNNIYSNIEKVLVISAKNEIEVKNEEIITIYAYDILNDYLSKGWVLLGLDYQPVADNGASLYQYIIGFPKSNSSQ